MTVGLATSFNSCILTFDILGLGGVVNVLFSIDS